MAEQGLKLRTAEKEWTFFGINVIFRSALCLCLSPNTTIQFYKNVGILNILWDKNKPQRVIQLAAWNAYRKN